MPKCETKFGNYFKLPNPGLRAYFDRVRKGQPDEYRTPFYKGKSLSQIIQLWDKQLLTIKSQWPTLYDYEIDLSEKVGPLSVMQPLDQRLDDIRSYYDLISLDQVPISQEALTAVLREWKQVAGLRIRSQDRTVRVMKKSTNSGSPYFTKRKLVVKDTVPCTVYQDGQSWRQRLNHSDWGACAILGWRGQEGGPDLTDTKQRVVWMFPFAVNIQELQVYQPLIEAFQSSQSVPAWVSMECVDREITSLFDTKGDSDVIICTDFMKFDQHFNRVCQEAARYLISFLFGNDASIKHWLRDVYPIKYNIALAYSWDHLFVGPHGMGSGSGGTNADETLTHRALQHEAALNAGKVLNPHSQCLGDDGVLTYPGCNVDDVMHTYVSHGLEMNPSKQYVSTQDCTYLRRWHHKDYRENGVCVGVYATMRALGRLCEQERFYDPEVWGPKMVALRQLSIIENVKYHPLRNEFADFCMQGDKFRLGLDIPGFLANIDREAKKAIDIMPDFLGYSRSLSHEVSGNASSGIKDWWIVQYLLSKS